jgi:hypothetical protein
MAAVKGKSSMFDVKITLELYTNEQRVEMDNYI